MALILPPVFFILRCGGYFLKTGTAVTYMGAAEYTWRVILGDGHSSGSYGDSRGEEVDNSYRGA